jgi:hypothetical protein
MTKDELARLLKSNPDLHVEGFMVEEFTAEKAREVGESLAKVRQPRVGLTEEDLHKSVMAQITIRANQEPDWAFIFHTPNGGLRHPLVASMLKAMGVKAGVPDLLWLLPRGRFHGLAMELKVDDNPTTAEQVRWLAWLTSQAYYTCIVRDDAEEAIRILEWYFNGCRPD